MAMTWQRAKKPPSAAAVAARKARAVEYCSPEYRAAEARIQAQVDAGVGICWRCRHALPLGKDKLGRRLWHVGHDDWDRRVIRGGECAACNLSNAAKKGNALSKGRGPDKLSGPRYRW